MKMPDIFNKLGEFKEKFKSFFQQKKQVMALENYDYVKAMNVEEKQILTTIKFCMKGSFPKEEDQTWIDSKLNRLQINYLDYAHRTKWVKSQFTRNQELKKPQKISPLQTTFDFSRAGLSIPIELLAQKQAAEFKARV